MDACEHGGEAMIGHNGNIIDLPYIGCYSGYIQDYCYLFGIEVYEPFYVLIILFITISAIASIFIFIKLLQIKFFNKNREAKR